MQPANAIHLSCNIACPAAPPRRRANTTSDPTIEPVSSQIPTDSAAWLAELAEASPTGLVMGAAFSMTPGATALPAEARTHPRTVDHTRSRDHREGKLPVGKSRKRKGTVASVGIQSQLSAHPAPSPPTSERDPLNNA